MPVMTLVCNDGDWSPVVGSPSSTSEFVCTGTITQIAQPVPTDIDPLSLVEAFGVGFTVCLPVIAVIFGGRYVLSTLR